MPPESSSDIETSDVLSVSIEVGMAYLMTVNSPVHCTVYSVQCTVDHASHSVRVPTLLVL